MNAAPGLTFHSDKHRFAILAVAYAAIPATNLAFSIEGLVDAGFYPQSPAPAFLPTHLFSGYNALPKGLQSSALGSTALGPDRPGFSAQLQPSSLGQPCSPDLGCMPEHFIVSAALNDFVGESAGNGSVPMANDIWQGLGGAPNTLRAGQLGLPQQNWSLSSQQPQQQYDQGRQQQLGPGLGSATDFARLQQLLAQGQLAEASLLLNPPLHSPHEDRSGLNLAALEQLRQHSASGNGGNPPGGVSTGHALFDSCVGQQWPPNGVQHPPPAPSHPQQLQPSSGGQNRLHSMFGTLGDSSCTGQQQASIWAQPSTPTAASWGLHTTAGQPQFDGAGIWRLHMSTVSMLLGWVHAWRQQRTGVDDVLFALQVLPVTRGTPAGWMRLRRSKDSWPWPAMAVSTLLCLA